MMCPKPRIFSSLRRVGCRSTPNGQIAIAFKLVSIEVLPVGWHRSALTSINHHSLRMVVASSTANSAAIPTVRPANNRFSRFARTKTMKWMFACRTHSTPSSVYVNNFIVSPFTRSSQMYVSVIANVDPIEMFCGRLSPTLFVDDRQIPAGPVPAYLRRCETGCPQSHTQGGPRSPMGWPQGPFLDTAYAFCRLRTHRSRKDHRDSAAGPVCPAMDRNRGGPTGFGLRRKT